MTEFDVWDFIDNAGKISFPDDVRKEWDLVTEVVPHGEPNSQYRLYLDVENRKFAKINIKTGINI